VITTRRAVFAVFASFAGPAGVFMLASLGRWPGALLLAALFGVWVGIEVISWLRRERLRRRQRWTRLCAAGRPLADVTESREGWWVA